MEKLAAKWVTVGCQVGVDGGCGVLVCWWAESDFFLGGTEAETVVVNREFVCVKRRGDILRSFWCVLRFPGGWWMHEFNVICSTVNWEDLSHRRKVDISYRVGGKWFMIVLSAIWMNRDKCGVRASKRSRRNWFHLSSFGDVFVLGFGAQFTNRLTSFGKNC